MLKFNDLWALEKTGQFCFLFSLETLKLHLWLDSNQWPCAPQSDPLSTIPNFLMKKIQKIYGVQNWDLLYQAFVNFYFWQKKCDVIRQNLARKKWPKWKIKNKMNMKMRKMMTSYDKISRGKNWLSWRIMKEMCPINCNQKWPKWKIENANVFCKSFRKKELLSFFLHFG